MHYDTLARAEVQRVMLGRYFVWCFFLKLDKYSFYCLISVESNRATITATNTLNKFHEAEQARLLAKIVDLSTQLKTKGQVCIDTF